MANCADFLPELASEGLADSKPKAAARPSSALLWPEMLNFSGSQHLRGQNIQNIDAARIAQFQSTQNIVGPFEC